jgi:formate-dependent nitrite reductase membrane component NrfD
MVGGPRRAGALEVFEAGRRVRRGGRFHRTWWGGASTVSLGITALRIAGLHPAASSVERGVIVATPAQLAGVLLDVRRALLGA